MNLKETEIFDVAAENYDSTFTHSSIGIAQRNRVYHWLDKSNTIKPTTHIFEINCGTGYDADIFYKKCASVIATDGSGKMTEKANQLRNNNIEFYQLDFAKVATDTNFMRSNLLFSNFGGLNCLSKIELTEFCKGVAQEQQKGDKIAWVIMPKFCIIETIYMLFKRKWKEIFRRNTSSYLEVNVEGVMVKTYYHSPKELKNILKKEYAINLVKPVALFVPPSYLESQFRNKKWLIKWMVNLDKTLGSFSFLSFMADHYLLIAEKK